MRERVQLEKRSRDDSDVMSFIADDEVKISMTESKVGYSLRKQTGLTQFTSDWTETKSQGRVVRKATQVYHKLSN